MNELFQWVWQSAALVAVVTMVMARARGMSASLRYRVWWATLAIVLVLPFFAALDLPGLGALVSPGAIAVMPAVDDAAIVTTPPPVALAAWVVWLPVIAYLVWFLVSGARFYIAFSRLESAKRSCRPFPVARERQMPRWRAVRNRGRRATLVVSDHVRAAGVLGLGYPRIAVAPSIVASLTDEELDQLVLHEYGHVQRYDDVASAVQLFMRIVIGWNPAAWWIDRRLRIEREVACDDWVLAMTNEPRLYARCLTRIADVTRGADSLLVPAASRQLTTRVLRLLDRQRNTSIRPSAMALAAATLVLAVLSVGLTGSQSTIVTLPTVAAAGAVRPADTPALTLAGLLQALAEPGSRRAPQSAAGVDDAAATGAASVFADVVHASQSDTDVRVPTHDAVPVVREAAPVLSTAADTGTPVSASTSDTGTAPAAAAETTADAEAPAPLESSDGWITATARALAGAGKSTGQSVAEAGVEAGMAVADAGVATAKGTQRAAVKTGKFFARVGRALSPF